MLRQHGNADFSWNMENVTQKETSASNLVVYAQLKQVPVSIFSIQNSEYLFYHKSKCFHKQKCGNYFINISWTTTGLEYVPGEPGAQWTEEEVRVTRLKILALLRSDSQSRSDMKMYGREARTINEMGIFRLAFHDCLA